MTLTAVVFPGQGSQHPGMRDELAADWPELLEAAEAAAGADPFTRLDDGTRWVQPAIYCASLAGWRRAQQEKPAYLAGHSLGELAALVAAGSLSVQDGLELVVLRGRLMQEAAEAAGDGGMLAVMGGREAVGPIAEPLRLTVANDNSPRQVVLSGDKIALRTAAKRAEEGGMRAIELPVAGAFHSPAMRAVVPKFRAALAEVDFRPPRIPVYCCLTAQPFEDVRGRLADGLVSPVRWRDTVVHLNEQGVTRFVETGPGRVLTGLIKRTVSGVETSTVALAHA